MLTHLPPELLSIVVEGMVREYLRQYFICYGESWDAISTLLGVSTLLRGITDSLLCSGLGILRLEDGMCAHTVYALVEKTLTVLLAICRLRPKPLVLIRMARRDANKRFEEACLTDDGAPPQNGGENDLAYWRVSPILELYSAIRETCLRRDRITRDGQQLRRLANLPNKLLYYMERARDVKDRRLLRPALAEGAFLIAGTTFGTCIGLRFLMCW